MSRLVRHILFVFALLYAGTAIAQPVLQFRGKITEEFTGKVIPGATIQLYKNGSVVSTVNTASNGKYDLKVDLEQAGYELKISAPGMVPKIIAIENCEAVDLELVGKGLSAELPITLFPESDKVDFSVIRDKPVGKLVYNPSTTYLEVDERHLRKMKKTIDDLLEELRRAEEEAKAREQEFLDLVQKGDDAMTSADYNTAIASYKAALDIKTDPAVKTKLEEAQQKLKEQEEAKQQEEEFNNLMSQADKAYNEGDLDNAVSLYKQASQIDPSNAAATNKITQIETEIAQREERKQEFNDIIAKADNSLGTSDFDAAISMYKQALQLMPNDPVAKQKLEEAEQKKEEAEEAAEAEAKKRQEFDQLMADGNSKMSAEEWEDAKSKYQEALGLFPDEQEPKDKIAEIDAKLEEIAQAEAEAEQKQQEYDALVKKADDLFDSEDWEGAKKEYEAALTIFPGEEKPTQRLQEIQQKLDEIAQTEAAEEAKRQEFDAVMAEANGLFGQEDWEGAKTKYEEALGILPDEQEPKDKIDEIEQKLEELAEAEAEAAAKQQEYDDLMAEGQKLFDKEEWEDAKSKYEAASSVFPDEQAPKDKITAIDQKLQELADAEAAEEAKKQEYDDLMSSANDLFGQESWEDAKSKYEAALAIFPDEQDPKDRIAEIDEKLSELAEAEAEEQRKRQEFDAIMEEANGLFASESWKDAKSKYQEALTVLPDEQEPKNKIQEIEDKLAELADAEAAAQAKQERYDGLMEEANTLFASESWEDAKEKYEAASKVFPDEQEPKNRIAEIDEKLSALADVQAAEQEKQDRYDNLISEGNNLMSSESWEDAKSKFEEALTIFPDEQEPKDKIQEIEDKLAELADAEAAAAAKQERYDGLMQEANSLFAAESWEDAKGKYEAASKVFPDEQEPKDRIAEIDEKLAALAEAQSEEEEKQALFDDLVAEADKAFEGEDYELAEQKYKEAFALFPKPEIQERIDRSNELLKEATRREQGEKQFQKIITKAEEKFNDGDLEGALDLYKRALGLKPDDQGAADRITAIEELIAQQGQKEEQYENLIANGDNQFDASKWDEAIAAYEKAASLKPNEQYPKDRIAEAKKNRTAEQQAMQRQEQYSQFIKDADNLFSKEKWEKAIETYQEALAIYPNEQYPQDRIAACRVKMKEAESVMSNKEQQAKYDEIIARADAAFQNKEYEAAKGLYKEAFTVMPEDYAQRKINEINEILKRQTQEQELNAQYQKILEVADTNFEAGDLNKARELYVRAKGLNPSDSYPLDQIQKIDQQLAAQENADARKQKLDEYTRIIEKADQQFSAGQLKVAKETYKQAYAVLPEQYAQDQINKINQLLAQESQAEIDRQYAKIIEVADKKFDTEDYKKARELYRRALGLKPNDPYPTKRLREIDGLLAQNPDEMYLGTEVSGSVLNPSVLLNQAKDNAYYRRVDTVESYIDSKSGFHLDNQNERIDVSHELTARNEDAMDEIARAKNLADDMRENNRDIIDEKIDAQTDTRSAFTEFNSENGLQHREYLEGVEKARSEEQMARDDNREANRDVVDQQVDAQTETRSNFAEFNSENGLEHREYLEGVEKARSEEQMARDDNRQANRDVVDQQVDAQTDTRSAFAEFNSENGLEHREYLEGVEKARSEEQMARDDNRQANRDVVDKQVDAQTDTRSAFAEFNSENGLEHREYLEGVEKARSEEQMARDDNRQENREVVDKQVDAQTETRSNFAEFNSENGLEHREYLEGVEKARSEEQMARDDNRQENREVVDGQIDEQRDTRAGFADGNQEERESNEDRLNDLKYYKPETYTPTYLAGMAKKYGEGIHTDTFTDENEFGDITKVTTRKIVVEGMTANIYIMVVSQWGKSYFINGQPVTEFQWKDQLYAAQSKLR